MNIKLCYLYRDGANYKKHGVAIFTNNSNKSVVLIEQFITRNLIESEWFYADKWGLPDLHFKEWDEEIDHNWHEFDCIEETTETSTREDIIDFLERIKNQL